MPTATAPAQPDTSIERLKAAWTHRLLSLAAPWAVDMVTLAAGIGAHHAWAGHGLGTAGAVAGLAAGDITVTAAAWFAARHRTVVLRVHSAVTALAGGAWLCADIVTGLDRITASVFVIGGATLCLTWNLRRAHVPAQAEGGAPARIADLFAEATDPAGVKGARLGRLQISPHKARGVVALEPGQHTAADLIRHLPQLESGMQLPPGSLLATEHPDRADLAHLVISDPTLMRQPIPWPGPSRPGASIEAPIRVGLWQDTDPAEMTITGYHNTVMGMTGSAKSYGGAYNWLGEVITREDVAVYGVDITKGDQTLGPLRAALHGLATDVPGARAMLAAFNAAVKPRTDYLASRGLGKWVRGCGLVYLVLWLEEVPDILDHLSSKQMEAFENFVRAARSAGMTIVLSLQRSTYDQLPTLVRGQTANWTFGVANSHDASYGLSEQQDAAGAHPERWTNRQPGMAYLDAPGVPEDRIAMPMRCYFWGDPDTGQMTTDRMTEHAAAWPASARPLDALTAGVLAAAGAPVPARPAAPARPLASVPAPADDDDDDELDEDASTVNDELGPDELDEDENPEAVRAEYLTEPDPDPDLAAGIDDPIEAPGADDPFGALEFPQPERLEPDQARARFRALLAEWQDEGRQEFTTSDLYVLLEPPPAGTGMSRAWLHKQINLATDDGLISPVTEGERGRFGRYELAEPGEAGAA